MQFRLEDFLNSYLPAGTRRVDAIVTVTAEGDSTTVRSQTVVGLILDKSGSMQGDRMNAVKHATRKMIELLDESVYFFVIAFADQAVSVFPLAQATPENKMAADAQVRRIEAGGGTRMSTALTLARDEFLKMPTALHYGLFLTDGKNNEEDDVRVTLALNQAESVFQCDCRGVGTDWQPKQLQKIAQKLLGTAMIIPDPAGVEADFRAAIQNAMGRAIGNVRLRIWTPKSARVLVCKQMSPEILVLTDRATQVDPQTLDYPTGAWGSEARDYYIAIELAPGEIGDEMLACRPSIVYQDNGQETKVAAPPVVVTWTDDEALSARINAQVAHYTGQEELAKTIQQGLEARAQGDVDAATHLFGRAAKLAHESGNADTTRRLAKVVDIVDAREGTVRLKGTVNKADEMDLDLGSTRTARAARRPQQGA